MTTMTTMTTKTTMIQSVTSRLETSRYRDFSQFFESIGLGLEKSLGIGLENFGLKVSVSVSKIVVSKIVVSKKSLGISLENVGLKKSSSYADIIFKRDTSNTFKKIVSYRVSIPVSKILVSRLVLIHCQRHKGQGIENFDPFNTFSSKQKLQQALES